jgi:prepilin-type N-terminal cleavage/methylation domain-containing protein
MVFRNTSTDTAAKRAVTLLEMMIAVAIGSIVITAVAYLMFYNARSLAALSNYADLDQDSRLALDTMSREIRSADGLVSYRPTEIIFSTGGGTNNLRYFYNADADSFSQFKNSARKELLTGCDAMAITIYGRNNISNRFSQFATTNVANAKMVQFTWTCSRDILGAKVNTESVQSAKIVIRKQN